MNQTTIILLSAAAILLILAAVLFFGKSNSKQIEKVEHVDSNYALFLNETYLRTGNLKLTLLKVQETYEEDPHLSQLIEKSLNYLQGEYGDYETALKFLNPSNDPQIEKLHNEIICLETAKTMGLPGA